ncbi:MAG TPA: hypothetical protein DCP97_03785 [Ruminococcaceae bacterium]|nr:hypothetical protein [Oscillospiraceae bacterium]
MRIKSAVIAAAVMLAFALSSCGKNEQPVQQLNDLEKIKKAEIINVGIRCNADKFSVMDQSTGKPSGYETDIAAAIAKQLLGDETKISFKEVTPETRNDMLQNGEVDMVIAGFAYTDEASRLYNLSRPYYTDSIAVAVNADSKITSLKQFKNGEIGIIKGSDTAQLLGNAAEKAGIKLIFAPYADFAKLRQSLEAGKISGFASYTSQLDNTDFLLKDRFAAKNYCIATKKQNTELAAFIDETLEKLAKKKQLKKMQETNGIVS